ncbi:hypothetical protein [Sorangium sp. So ce1099]|uniref:hypothetical protein n=1 Tax=Sorangium sp. So ce1099 TaxID=3133331 RepID=UPI003F5DAA66
MRKSTAVILVLLLSPWATGCGTAPGVNDPGVTPCEGTSCESEPPPESVCVEHVAADILDDGCGVFLAGNYGFGDDRNPGTKAKPVYSVARAIELARAGRGRVFLCNDGFVVEQIRVPSGVDLLGGFHCRKWDRDPLRPQTTFTHRLVFGPTVVVEPAGPEDSGAADGVSTLADLYIPSWGPVGVLAQSNTAVEILRSEISANGGGGGIAGGRPQSRQPDGPDGNFGGDACSAAVVAGGPAVVNQCENGVTSTGGKGGDGRPDSAEDGGDGEPADAPPSGAGGTAEQDNVTCYVGSSGSSGVPGTQGAPGKGIGRLTETGWEGDTAGEGTWGTPGQGGGGGGGRRGGVALCGAASKGGPGGGSGGAGGCGGRGGRGGGNGQPSIGVLALHARVTVRDTRITANFGGNGGDGGEGEKGGRGGRGAPGGLLGDDYSACFGGMGGLGGSGGYGGPGRGGDSIGVAYLDEDQLTLEGVTIETGLPGKGGTSWGHDGSMTVGEGGEAHETLRFPE